MTKPKTLGAKLARGLLSLRQAAPLVGLSYPTLLKLAKAGQVRTIKVGDMLKISTEEINRFLRDGNYDPSSPASTPKVEVLKEDEEQSNVPAYIRGIAKVNFHDKGK